DARFVIAIDIRTHRELGFFLCRIEQLTNVLSVAERIAGSARRTGNRTGLDAVPFDPYEHFWRGADKLLIAELDQKLVRARAGLLHAKEQIRRLAGVRPPKGLAEHYSVIIPPRQAGPNRLNIGHVFLRLVVGDDCCGLAGRAPDLRHWLG